MIEEGGFTIVLVCSTADVIMVRQPKLFPDVAKFNPLLLYCSWSNSDPLVYTIEPGQLNWSTGV